MADAIPMIEACMRYQLPGHPLHLAQVWVAWSDLKVAPALDRNHRLPVLILKEDR